MSQLWGIPQPQYSVTSLLEPHQTYFWNITYIIKKTPKLVAKIWLPNLVLYQTAECDSKNLIFNLVLLIGIFKSSNDNALWWMLQDLPDDKSTLVQVMAWCCQATSHYPSQCWLSSLSTYGIARPQWAKFILRILFPLLSTYMNYTNLSQVTMS